MQMEEALIQISGPHSDNQRWHKRFLMCVGILCGLGLCGLFVARFVNELQPRTASRKFLEQQESLKSSSLPISVHHEKFLLRKNKEKANVISSSYYRWGRKLLAPGPSKDLSTTALTINPVSRGHEGNYSLQVERIGDGACTIDDIAIFQGETGPLPNGIPSFTVQIFNLCLGGCAMGDIHVSCGWFASATLVNPKLFKRLGFDDCIVNAGKPLHPGESLTFHYSNSFQYPFSVHNAVHVPCSKGPGH